MAKKESQQADNQNTSSVNTQRFDQNLERDINDFHRQETSWSYARNAINNSNIGDLGKLGNEPANKLCVQIWQDKLNKTGPLTIIGFIHLEDDKWIVFSTDNFNSEIGFFEESVCQYYRIVNDPCLNFKTTNLVYGQSREIFDCTHSIYWADGLNPDRYMNIGDIRYAPYADPWPGVPYFCVDQNPVPACTLVGGGSSPCFTCQPTYPLSLVCDKLRLETFMTPICLEVSKGEDAGELRNGSYFATAAYAVNGFAVTDYCTPSNVQALFEHDGAGGSLRIKVCAIDNKNFDEFELVVVYVVEQQTVAKRLGTYNTNQEEITVDIIDQALATVPIEQIPIRNVIYEKSDAIFKVNDNLIRVAPTAKFQFNYQPLANQIRSKWVSVEYPEDYYKKGGNNTGYMRDEVYSFFIRWVYKTGDKSASFHIPGRPYINDPDWDARPIGLSSLDVIELEQGFPSNQIKPWMVYNTAPSVSPYLTIRNNNTNCPYNLCDGGVVIAEGYMGYWESSESYPDYKPEIWNASAHEWSCLNPPGPCQPSLPYPLSAYEDYDLCGRNIRHHKFPENDLHPSVSHFRPLGCIDPDDNISTDVSYNAAANPCPNLNPPIPLSDPNKNHIRILGVQFENIRPPVDNDGKLIPNIVGYEILRGSRTGNKSVIAKGIVNNMWEYDLNIKGNTSIKGLFQNYPFNDLFPNPYLSSTRTNTRQNFDITIPDNYNKFDTYRKDIFSFHSPETNFTNPFLASTELKIYQDLCGSAELKHKYVDDHPNTVIVKDIAVLLALLAGLATATITTTGKKAQTAGMKVNISNISGPKLKWTNDVKYNLAAVVYGSSGSLIQTDTYENEEVNQLAEDAVSDAKGENQSSEIRLDGVVTPSGGRKIWNILKVAFLGSGYSNLTPLDGTPNGISKEYFKTLVKNAYDVNKKTGYGFTPYMVFDWGVSDYLPAGLYTLPSTAAFLGGASQGNIFLYYLTEAAEVFFRAIFAFSKPRSHELQTVSHCLYNGYGPRLQGERRRYVSEKSYIDNQIHPFTLQYRINNLYRSRFVALQLTKDFQPPFQTSLYDETRNNTLLIDDPADVGINDAFEEFKPFIRPSSTYYAAIKQRLRNQYGQLPNIKQIPISCNINYCIASSNRFLKQQEGYDLRGLSTLSQCTNNIVVEGDFPNATSIDIFPASWQSLPGAPNPPYWTATSVIVGGNTYTVARNDGPANLTNTSPPPTLYQIFPGATIIPPTFAITNFSFNLVEFPNDPSYTLNVYLGPAGTGQLLTSVQGGNLLSLPSTISVTNVTNSTTVSHNRITFELELGDLPTSETADVLGYPQLEGPLNGQNPTYRGRCAYSWFTFTFDNQQGSNNSGGNISTSSDRLDLSFPTPGPSGSVYPSIYDSTVDNGKVENYISDISCPTRVTWNFRFKYRWYPCYCDSTTITPACRALWGGPNAANPYDINPAGPFYYNPAPLNPNNIGCQTLSNTYYFGKPRSVLQAAYGTSQNTVTGNLNPFGVTDAQLASCLADGNFTITLRKITPSTPGNNAGAALTTVYNQTFFNTAYSPLITTTGTFLIDGSQPGGYEPDARYYFLIETSGGVNFIIDGGDIEVSSCETEAPVSITDVCLEAQTLSGNPGCMDNTAANYNPLATYDDFSCMYYACLTPGNQNTVQQVQCPSCPGITINGVPNQYQGLLYIPCELNPNSNQDCCVPITNNPTVNLALNNIGYGNCNWPCTSAYTGGNTQFGCVVTVTNKTYPLFGGDIYVGRYSEKNSFFYFTNWMYKLPDRSEYDYLKYKMISYPTYWYNTQSISVTEIVNSFISFITNPFLWSASGLQNLVYPSNFHVLDRKKVQVGLAIKYGYIYLFNSSVREFYCESEYNLDLRDYGEEIQQRHYQALGEDSFTDLDSMFRTDVIKNGNYYKYNNSLSIAKIWYSYVGWGNVYPAFYDPEVAETCYVYKPERLLYSLPASITSVRDNWRIYLSNNYKDFIGRITSVRQINKSGVIILFDTESPLMFQGTDQLQTDLGTKLTIGDGGLFSQPSQNITNAERAYQFASCQNKLSVINTPVGTFWISQNQGKIFQYSSSFTEISMKNIKWWLAQYLPYKLTSVFPAYSITDNPVSGIGCQTVYDNTNNLVYFTKKDYMPKKAANGQYYVIYDNITKKFLTNPLAFGSQNFPSIDVELGDPLYFEDASWTISFDVKTEAWISFHDWHPDLTVPGKNTFMTTKGNGIWVHNQRCDLYTNYYGESYPFEVEYTLSTIQNINILRSVEYQLEAYKYKYENCYDRFHMLDYNFDEAVIYNTEQCSGLLKLNLTPKNNAPRIVQYPIVNPTNIQILYSKEENKYRFNQFWDITRDRGEFDWVLNDYNNNVNSLNTAISAIPGNLNDTPDSTVAFPGGTPLVPGNYAQQTIWNTESSGYKRTLNASNLNYSKLQLQHKKFRHYTTSVLLRRKAGQYNNVKMLVSLANNKNYISFR